mgnify:CR=1 FL=1
MGQQDDHLLDNLGNFGGKVAQNQGFQSIMSGLVIVLVFMVFYYSGGGLIANLALFFNIFFKNNSRKACFGRF